MMSLHLMTRPEVYMELIHSLYLIGRCTFLSAVLFLIPFNIKKFGFDNAITVTPIQTWRIRRHQFVTTNALKRTSFLMVHFIASIKLDLGKRLLE